MILITIFVFFALICLIILLYDKIDREQYKYLGELGEKQTAHSQFIRKPDYDDDEPLSLKYRGSRYDRHKRRYNYVAQKNNYI